jgi:hypothetical protein
MQPFKHISAYFFLSIFSVLLLHQALPHNHHQHELNDAIEISGHHHSHAHSHDHDKEENKDPDDLSGLLGFLLGSHAHTYHSNDFQVRNEVKPQIQVLPIFVLPQLELFSFDHHSSTLEPVPRFTTGYQHLYLSIPSLRGPPVLG